MYVSVVVGLEAGRIVSVVPGIRLVHPLPSCQPRSHPQHTRALIL